MTDKIFDAQRRWTELYDQWKQRDEVVQKLQADVTAAFARVARGEGGNPSDALLALLEKNRQSADDIQREMDAIIASLDD